MDDNRGDLRVDPLRMRRDFDELSIIGSTGDGGVHRPALSESHLEARKWFRQRIETDGFEFHLDQVGNHSVRLPAPDPTAKTLMLGSHLDSVPYGGRFDGPLGVLAAYEVLRTIRESGILLPVHLEAIDFTDEEGTLVGLLGSRALAGSLTRGELTNPRGGRSRLEEGMRRSGLDEERIFSAKRKSGSLVGFLEVHIEQGPRLTSAGADIGIVTALVGIGSFAITFIGKADHAGTTPMDARLDAGMGAADYLLAVRQLVMQSFPDCVANVGQVVFKPGAMNIVPARAKLLVEYRAPEELRMGEIKNGLLDLAAAVAQGSGLDFEVIDMGVIQPTPCAPEVQEAFRSACDHLGLTGLLMNSGAGHDTMAMASICPAGMIFIPSAGGSHSPREHAKWEDCINGANVLLHAALKMVDR